MTKGRREKDKRTWWMALSGPEHLKISIERERLIGIYVYIYMYHDIVNCDHQPNGGSLFRDSC